MRRQKPRREIFECPNCGADVPVGAKACRECGSDAETGWQSREEIDYQGTDLPEGYGGEDDTLAPPPRTPLRWLVVVLLVVALVLWLVFV